MELEKFKYDNKTVKWFAYATLFWGIVGMLAGLLAALQREPRIPRSGSVMKPTFTTPPRWIV